MVVDQLKTHALKFHRNDLWDDCLQMVKFDFGIQTSELSACAKPDDELFKRSHKVRPGYEHEHHMVECSAQKQPIFVREIHNLRKQLAMESDQTCVHLIGKAGLVCG